MLETNFTTSIVLLLLSTYSVQCGSDSLVLSFSLLSQRSCLLNERDIPSYLQVPSKKKGSKENVQDGLMMLGPFTYPLLTYSSQKHTPETYYWHKTILSAAAIPFSLLFYEIRISCQPTYPCPIPIHKVLYQHHRKLIQARQPARLHAKPKQLLCYPMS